MLRYFPFKIWLLSDYRGENMADFGETLRAERKKQELTLEKVEEETKIRKLYLNALEEENFSILPPRVYASGFVKRYATFLGLDTEQLVQEFQKLAYPEVDEEEEDALIEQEKRVKRRMAAPLPWRNIAVALIFLIVAIWAGKYIVSYLTNHNTSIDSQPNRPPVSEPAPQNEGKTDVKQKEAEQTPAKVSGLNLEVQTYDGQSCWLMVTVDGQTVFNATLDPGDKKSFQAKESIVVKAGNAGGVKLVLNGEQQPSLGKVGDVVEKSFTVSDSSDNKELR